MGLRRRIGPSMDVSPSGRWVVRRPLQSEPVACLVKALWAAMMGTRH